MKRRLHQIQHTLARHLCLLALLLLAGCSDLKVYSARSPTASFAGYRTYTHGAPEKTPTGFARTPITPEVWTKVQADIDAELAKKGYTPAIAGAEPDVVVRSGSGSRTVTRDEGAMTRVPWVSADVVTEYTQATLVIDVFDAHTNQQVWHGSSRRALDAQPATVRDASIAEAVQAILRTFPNVAGPPPAP
jgi:Domain of unknown function (DUF4136)